MKFISNFYTFLFITSMTIFISVSHANNVGSNEVEKLITQHLQASGGGDALMKMQSISRDGQITFYQPNGIKDNFCYHTDIVYPTKLREQIKGKKIEYDRGTDGAVFWLWNGSQYEFTEDRRLLDYMRNTAERANRDMLWTKKESNNFEIMAVSASWAPKHSQCIQEIKPKESVKRIYCFDASTGLLNALGNDKEYRLESDWRSVSNIKIPFRLTHYQDGVMVYEVQLSDAKLNNKIPEARFVKPSIPQLSCVKD